MKDKFEVAESAPGYEEIYRDCGEAYFGTTLDLNTEV
jgi:hypothetical protein